MAQKPTVQEIRGFLNATDVLGLRNAEVRVVSEHSHLVYQIIKGGRVYALRMINPESHRAAEWISMYEEYQILDAIWQTGLGPRVSSFRDDFLLPCVIQEFVTAACFNDLKPLSEEHLIGAARAIARLNEQPLTPSRFPFLKKYTVRSFEKRMRVWQYRLLWACYQSKRRDVIQWMLKIQPILLKAFLVLSRFEMFRPRQDYSFHFDGAHCGNTYWRDGRVIFLDWEKVSWRNDSTFTLVRFATSVDEKGIVDESVLTTLVDAYLAVRPIPHFAAMARMRFLERQVSDLVWVVWEAVRRGDRRPVEQGTSVVRRFQGVRALLQHY